MSFTPKFVDLARNTTTTTGTGNFVLGPAVNGFTGLAQALQVGDSFYYSCVGTDKPAEREVGRGTLLAGGAISRDPVSGTKTNFTSGTKTIAVIAAAEWFSSIQSGAGGSAGPAIAATRSELAGISDQQKPALMCEGGREGLFVWDGSDLSAEVAKDPQQAIYVAPASMPSGASGAWARKFSGGASARWFGAKGDGTTNDAAALQAWLDRGGDLYLPAGTYKCSARLIVRRTVNIRGEGYGFDDVRQTAGALTPGARILFDAGVGGLDVQPQVSSTVIPAGAATQEGGYNSQIRDIELAGGGGAAATGLYSRTLVHLTNVHCLGFSGKGFDISASTVDPGPIVSEYGNASLSTLTRCVAQANGSHGFHIRGMDANVIKLDSCNASSNGGWGFLDESVSGNHYVNCHAAANGSGSYKCLNGVADSTYTGCYVEPDSGEAPDLSSRCSVIGGSLGNSCRNVNAGTSGHPNIAASNGFEATGYGFKGITEESMTVANGRGLIYRGANRGLTIMGAPDAGGTYDVSVANKNSGHVFGVLSGTTTTSFTGAITAAGGITVSSGNAAWNAATQGTGSGGLHFPTNGVDDQGNAITFGSNTAAGTAAGIYVTGTSASGSSMFLSTSDVYSAGAKTAISISPSGNVSIPRGSLSVTGTIAGSNLGANGLPSSLTGLSVVGRAANSAGASAAITGTDGQVLRVAGTTLGFGTIAYAGIQNVTGSRLLGNPTGSAAALSEIALAGGLTFSGTTLTAAGALTPTSIASSGAVTSSGGGVGYATGAGGAVTQTGSKSTAVTLNKSSGQVTTHTASMAAAAVVSFVVNNGQIAATDTINLNLASGNATAGTYRYWVEAITAGSFKIVIENRSAGALAEALVFNFAVLKAVNA